jgi:hypothetical protein
MNTKYFAALMIAVITTGLSQSITLAQASQLVTTPKFSDVLVQPSPLSLSQPINAKAPPPIGRPPDRTPAGTHAAPAPKQLSIF